MSKSSDWAKANPDLTGHGVSIVDAIAWSAGVFLALGSVAYALGIFRAFHPEKES